ncbi:MAG: SprT family zinc-dependent metalloprotease [Methylococcales bacterium]
MITESVITVGDLLINVVRKDIKNLHLGVYPPDGRLRVAVPLKTNDDAVRLMVISKMVWIKKQLAKFAGQQRQAQRHYVSGESYYLKGQRYLLNVIYHPAAPNVVIRHNTHIDLTVRSGSSEEKRQQVMTEWYRQQLKARIPALIDKWQLIIGVEVHDWGIKQMKTKWGTCNISARRIWLNLDLVQKPEHCLEYIIVHELVHLLERHHNDKFTAYMDQFMPQWRTYRDELNQFILNHADWSY